MDTSYLTSVKKQFEYYKSLGDKTFIQLTEEQFFWLPNADDNSIAIIVKHIAGNMLSRWTNFLTEDGEKEWRNRDDEFINSFTTKEEVIAYWENGWQCLFKALNSITEENSNTIVYIRNQGHTITEAINRQLCHYSYHVGQIVFLGRLLLGKNWKSLSIAKNASKDYNAEKFSKEKSRTHFTDDL
ncbi:MULTISPECIES: DUF1572 family protein [unclassified Tenacibaculum]|uniref:DUF1572 family protein n=1 Tax=unclassified Tenacibaculum TaxID=2635139 RepID=UPI001F197267|nr:MULTISPECIES: DUF1572 family protein [unclassified Tenacibaculum]MCF2875105.1 DUF1572 domain-containing protein [Tenacibaculum sp. Cn5-1]MCF2935181.1 DUF1572 domain-containing protein [Tenacibaculum sp. Cn5-34]MCG7511377.1 DUF1572 domain-containing protein [Tenacibaculum sp. Cn5-46]